MNKKEHTINWIGLIILFISAFIFSIVGWGLKDIIFKLNPSFGNGYATAVSYFTAILLHHIIMFDIRLTKEKEEIKDV